MPQRVFVDANVLFSKTLMDWLFLLRRDCPGMFQVHTTEDVLAEVVAKMRKKNPRAPGRTTAHRARLIRDCLDEVLSDFPPDLPFSGTDPDDYHVHAGAVASQADLVLTCNNQTDITTSPDAEPYEVIHPDDFFLLVATSNPSCLIPIAREQVNYWASKENHCQLDEALTRAGCPGFARTIRGTLALLAHFP